MANYHALEETSKQESLKKRTHYKEQKQKILENKRAKHQALDKTGKHELLKKMRDHYKQRKQKFMARNFGHPHNACAKFTNNMATNYTSELYEAND